MAPSAGRATIGRAREAGALRSLPRHHVARPHLTARLGDGPVAVIEAAGGYGKSVLAAEYAASLGVATAVAGLGPGDDEVSSVAVRLRDALSRAGLSDLSAALGARLGGAEPLGGLTDALVSTPEPTLVVIDDVQYATQAGESLLRFVRELPEPHRLVLLARRLPAGLERLRREPGVVVLTATDLAFGFDDVVGLYQTGFGVALEASEARALVRATGGWAAALVLAAPRIAETPEPAAVVAALEAQGNVLAYLVQDALSGLQGSTREAAIALAHLPVITDDVIAAVGGDGFVTAAADAGLPLARTEGGWWAFPGPVEEILVRAGRLPVAIADRVAASYADAGLHEQALDVLLGVQQGDSAAALLARLRPAEVEAVDFEHVRHVVAALPDSAVQSHPRVYLQLARACEPAAAGQTRARALEDARRLASASDDGRLLHEVDAETAKDLVRDGRLDEAARLVERVLAELGPDETATRARLLHTLGRVKAFRFDPARLAEAEPLLREAARLYELMGEPTWRAQALLVLGYHVQFPQGRHEDAEATLSEALDVLPGASRFRAVVLTFLSDVLSDRGRYAEFAAASGGARRIGELLGDQRVLAYVAWNAARVSSQSGDAAATLEHLREVERHRGDWFEHATGAEFLADAAVLLDRVGETGEARRYLRRATSRAAESKALVLLADGAVEARSGDPARAESLLAAALELEAVETRDAWRISLLRAYAALRRGEDAGELAALAFEQAAEWTSAPVPLLRERALTSQLLALAVDAGSAAAGRLHVGDLPITVALLGGFEIRQGGRPLTPPPGKPTTLAKLVATRGSVHSEEASDALWPEVDPESGRRRLRNVLNRLRSTADIVVRHEQTLELAPGIEVDARRFGEDANRSLSLARGRRRDAVALARRAVARYRGELLPDDPYEPWASIAREWMRGRYVELLDLLVDDAEATGELDEALRLQRRRLEVDPLDEEQYLRGARLLAAQGRRLAAVEMLRRGTELLDRFDLPVPPAFGELAETLLET